MSSQIKAYVLVALAALLAGAVFAWQFRPAAQAVASQPVETEVIGQPRPPYTLGATDGRQVSASEFDGDVVLVNFWATWCAPCRKEMPMLVEVQKQYGNRGLSVVGIALDDVAQARDFARDLGVDYTVLVGGADVMAAITVYGNRSGVLPYSVLLDRDGIVRWTYLGELERSELIERIEALL